MDKIIIIGAGGIGKETAFLIEQINECKHQWEIVGFVDDNIEIQNRVINGYKVLGSIEQIKYFEDIYVVCAISNYEIKKKIVNKMKSYNIRFANIIHPSVCISDTNAIGEGVIIYPGVIMTTNIRLGSHVIISPKCGIGHETIIEDYVSLLWNVNISGNDLLKEGCMLGSGCTVIQNKKVGKETIVGAGAVVIKDLPDRCTAVGIPAKPIKYFK